MNANVSGNVDGSTGKGYPLTAPIAAGVVSWIAISLGCLGLKFLMEARPEFVGPPIRTVRSVLVQESPRLVTRKISDDVSVINTAQPLESQIRFDMQGRRDYRGLRTISDMAGRFAGRYIVTNSSTEPMFVLFKCPHPRTEEGTGNSPLAGGLKLQASSAGVQENTKDGWLWSGTLPAREAASIDISYEVASLQGVTYRIAEQAGTPVNHVAVAFHRTDLDSMAFECGDGLLRPTSGPVIWERKNFLGPDSFSAAIREGRSLFTALAHLVEIGPLISALFLTAVLAIVQARRPLTAVQMFTISAGYAFYFPLILYLSSRFSFGVALIIAMVVPGSLLLNYSRWLMGKAAVLGGALLLALYQLFPTLAAFTGWNRGMVLLCLGVVTLGVLINLQNRTLRRQTGSALLLLLLLLSVALLIPSEGRAAQVQVVLPADWTKTDTNTPTQTEALIGFERADYQVRHEPTHFQIEMRLPFEVVRPGDTLIPLLPGPVFWQDYRVESSVTNLVQRVTTTNRLALYAKHAGKGVLALVYRVPVGNHEGKRRAQIPILVGPSGSLRIESYRHDLDFLNGSQWSKTKTDQTTVYDVGVAGEEYLTINWSEQDDGRPGGATVPDSNGLYGIGLTRAQHLTVINSDGSCTHFAEFELPATQKEDFRLRLPPSTQLISASLDGVEIRTPLLDNSLLCRVQIPTRSPGQKSHRLSFRLAYPPIRLGFIGSIELALPEVFEIAGVVDWVISLPTGFQTQVISSGLVTQKGAADLSLFGDYGNFLKSHPSTRLAKNLAPPGKTTATLKYRQAVAGFQE